MKSTNLKRNIAFILVMVLMITTVNLPVNMEQAYAEENVSEEKDNLEIDMSGNNTGEKGDGSKDDGGGSGKPGGNGNPGTSVTTKPTVSVSVSEDSIDIPYKASPIENLEVIKNFKFDVSGNAITNIEDVDLSIVCKWVDSVGNESKEAPTNVGEYKVEVLSISGNDTYVIEEGSFKITIVPRPLDPVIEGTVEKVYDGGTDVPKGNLKISLNGVLGKDDVKAEAKFRYKSTAVGNNIPVEGYDIELTGDQAGNYKLSKNTTEEKCGTITKAKSNISEADKEKLQNLEATCGQKLSEIKLPAGWSFKQEDKNKEVYCGKKETVAVVYVENGNAANYSAVDGTANITVKSTLKTVKSKDKNIVHKRCNGCGQQDFKFNKTVEVTIGKKISLKKIMTDGRNFFESIEIKPSDKKYISVDEKGRITAKNIKAKNYKKLPKKVKVTVKYAGGEEQKIAVALKIPKPNVRVKRTKVVIGGEEAYRYTFKYNVKYASKVKVTVDSGVKNAKLKKDMDDWFRQTISGNKGTVSFTISKSLVTAKSKKIKFKVVAQYGKNKSQPQTVSR